METLNLFYIAQRKYLIFIFSLLNCLLTFSQSIQRSTSFSATGKYSNTGTLQIESNIGELMADTYNNSQYIFTQGFVQPESPLTTTTEQINPIQNGNVFPNPVSDKLNVQFELINPSDIKIEVYDIMGKVQIINISYDTNKKNIEINFEQVSPGIYFVKIISINNQYNKIFKINKI